MLGCVARLEVAERAADRDAGAAIRQRGDARALRPAGELRPRPRRRGRRPTGEPGVQRRDGRRSGRRAGMRSNAVDPLAANVLAAAASARHHRACRSSTADRIVGAISPSAERRGRPCQHRRAGRSLGDRARERPSVSHPADRDRRAARRRGVAADLEPAQGRVPGDALARAAQSARADPHRARGDPPARAGRAEADLGDRRHRPAGQPPDAPGRGPARRRAHQPGQDRAADRSRSTCAPWSRMRVETAKPFVEARRHQLRSTVPDAPVMLRGDFARLSQVVANLLNNAAQVHRRRRLDRAVADAAARARP